MVLRKRVILQYLVRLASAPTRLQTQNPGLGMKSPNPGLVMAGNRLPRSALEAGVWLTVVKQVADAVHRVLEDRCGGEDDHADRGIDERDHIEGGDKTGDLADETEVFECFHGDLGVVSTRVRRLDTTNPAGCEFMDRPPRIPPNP